MRPCEGAAAEYDDSYGARGRGIVDAHVTTTRFFLDGHFRDDGNAHARADHAEQAAELAAFENNLRMEAGAIAGRHGGISKTVAVTQKKERFGAKVLERKRAMLCQLVSRGKCREKRFVEQGKCLELVAANGKSEDGEIDFPSAELIEEHRSDVLDDGEAHLRKLARESHEVLRKKIRRHGRNNTDGHGATKRVFLFGNITAGGFQLA